MLRFGVISDTHGLLRPRALELLEGCSRILHAGDVGQLGILEQLEGLAPVTAVRGNVDHGETGGLPPVVEGELAGLSFVMTHRREDVDPGWTRRASLIVYGHSHRPELEWRGGCLLLNPGAAGPRRFKLPLTLARLSVLDGRLIPEILSLED